MFRILVTLFILVPIIEIAVFIQIGEVVGLSWTLVIVVLTAILGVNLLRQQGFRAWRDIQLSMAQGNMPAVEMASAAQLLFAGGLLLTPGFVTDIVGFTLMIPSVRTYLAKKLIAKGSFSTTTFYSNVSSSYHQPSHHQGGRTIDGEFEEKDKFEKNNSETKKVDKQ